MESIELSPEKIKSAEIRPRIRLELFRHDEREEIAEPGIQDVDLNRKIHLSQKGRTNSRLKGIDKNPNPQVALAYGSMRDRTIETSLRHILSDKEDLDSLDYDNILNLAKHGSMKKYIRTPLLDYDYDSNEQFRREIDTHYFEKKDMLRFLYCESDDLAERLKDKKSTTYSRSASNIAKLINKYIQVLPAWSKLTTDKPEKFREYGFELQRFMGSHGGNLECFLMKVIERQQGEKGVMDFINSLPDPNGFGYSEGYTVVLEESDGKTRINISYNKNNWSFDPDFLKEIIQK